MVKKYLFFTVVIFCILFVEAQFVFGDVLKLKNGGRIEGVIKEDNDKMVKLKVKNGEVIFTPAEIDAIVKSSDKENVSLENSWAMENIKSDVKEAVSAISESKDAANVSEGSKPGTATMADKDPGVKKTSPQAPEPKSISWSNDLSSGLNKASKNMMPVMIDFYTDWCGWCKKLDSDVYGDPRVIKIASKFVCVKINGDTKRELVSKYGVGGYPTIVFLNSKGKEVDRIPGFRPADGFLSTMQEVLDKK